MTTIGVSGWMFLLVPAHPGCPGQNPESWRMVVCVSLLSAFTVYSGSVNTRCVCVCVWSLLRMRAKVWKLRSNSELFDIAAYTANLERVYRRMWEKHEKGEPVDHITDLAEPYSWMTPGPAQLSSIVIIPLTLSARAVNSIKYSKRIIANFQTCHTIACVIWCHTVLPAP